jgi:hypothetical protein
MELWDSRCLICREKSWQCSACAKKDGQARLDAKKAAAAKKKHPGATLALEALGGPAPAPAPACAAAVAGVNSEGSCAKKDGQTRLKTKKEAAAKKHHDTPLMEIIPGDEVIPAAEIDGEIQSGPGTFSTLDTTSASLYRPTHASPPTVELPRPAKLRTVLKKHNWTILRIPPDGHCFFHSIVKGMVEHRIPDCPKTALELRAACAAQLLAWNGDVPLPGYEENHVPMFDECGKILYQATRGGEEKKITLKDYCALLRTSMYGGTDEIMMIVQMYKCKIFFYSESLFKGGDPIPEVFLMHPLLPEDDEKNAGHTTIYFGVVTVAHSHSLLIASFIRSIYSLAFGARKDWRERSHVVDDTQISQILRLHVPLARSGRGLSCVRRHYIWTRT